MNSNGVHRSTLLGCVAAGTLLAASAFAAKTEVPLFLLSGQSNMSGMDCPISGLTEPGQKDSVKNVKIYQDAEGSIKRTWLTLKPGFGFDNKTFGPELFLGKILADSLPDMKFAFIKVARAGTYLGKATEWLPPSSNNGTGGKYYTAMMESIDHALKTFTTAYDTAQYTPRWVGFVWLQGEFDAQSGQDALANAYEKNLTNLITDIRIKTKVDDLPVILPMIDSIKTWPLNGKIRAADIACTKKLKNVDTVDTKGFESNGIHYQPKGQIKIGTRTAQRWLAMKYLKDIPVSIAIPSIANSKVAALNNIQPTTLFDLSGRRVAALTIYSSSSLHQAAPGCFILQSQNPTGRQTTAKTVSARTQK